MVGADPHDGPDPGVFDARLRDYEWWLFRGIMLSRVAIVLGLGVILPDERSVHGSGVFVAILIAWAAALVWVGAPLRSMRSSFDVLKARPALVWVDVAALAILLAAGGGWRNPFYLYAWSPLGLASVVLTAKRTLGLIAAACGFQVASFAVWHAGGWDPAAQRVDPSAWASPLLGYVIVGGLFWYVRRRFDDLQDAAAAYSHRAEEAITATRSAAAATEREEVAYQLHRRLRQVFPALGLRLAALGTETSGDRGTADDVAALAGVAVDADMVLDGVIARLQGGEGGGTGRAGTFGTGRGPSGFVG